MDSEAALRLPEQQVAYTMSKLHQVKLLLRHKLRSMALRRKSACLPCVELAASALNVCSLLTQNTRRLAITAMYGTHTDMQELNADWGSAWRGASQAAPIAGEA